MKHAIAAVAPAFVVGALIAGVHAQGDRLVMPHGPAPNQIVHFRQTQELTMDVVPADPGSIPPATIVMKTIMTATVTVGALDERKRFDATVTIDDYTAETMMNGAPMPIPAVDLQKGARFTIKYDENRAITDVTGDMPSAVDVVKQMLEAVAKLAPSAAVAIGETVDVPLNIPLPNLPTGPLGALTGSSTMTLKAISVEAGDRIGHFGTTFSMKLGSGDAGAAAMDFEMKGTGMVDLNETRGIPKSATQEGTIDGSLALGAMPAIKMHGTIRMSTQSNQ